MDSRIDAQCSSERRADSEEDMTVGTWGFFVQLMLHEMLSYESTLQPTACSGLHST